MRHFYLFTLIFSSYLQAQLSISPSAAGDSYLYLNNEVLFVEKEIQLSRNKKPETKASIYLRNEAQLLQGNKTANLNAGDGFISVFQEGTSNAFDYNYWSLPVTNNLSVTDKFGENIFEPQTTTLSTQVKLTSELNGSASPLTISKRWIYKFSGSGYSSWNYVGDIFDVKPGEGFTMKGVNGINSNTVEGVQNNPGSSQRYDFRGLPNDGEISVHINKDEALLSGNPYPSALDLKSFLLANTNTTGIAYYWDSKENGTSHNLKEYEGGYGAYSPGANVYAPAVFKKYAGDGNEVGNSGNAGNVYGREFSPIAQGFFLIGIKDGPVTFKNTYRSFQKENNNNSSFRSQVMETEIPDLSGFRLNVDINDEYTRQLILVFREDSSIGADRAMDAKNFGELKNDAGWLIEDEHYVINVLPFSAVEMIPLILNFDQDGSAGFGLEFIRELPGVEILLFDSLKNEYFNISGQSMSLELDKGEYKNRFYLSLKRNLQPQPGLPAKPDKLTYLPEGSAKINISQNNSFSRLEISLDELSEVELLGLYSLKGQLIYRKKVDKNEKYLEIPTGNLSNAVYIIKLTEKNGKTYFKKLSVKN
ncbi:T9SS type A sorting domain-containing protein [Salegentibacter chungangensis]|uniref:T9SS type A sorting domain-containing protein n=1 Tax=Salegentibacter chungangensis TaxID=1335724 RepID=A0ABW3NVS0_9FLAO